MCSQFSDEVKSLDADVMCSSVAESVGDLMATRSTFIDSPLFYSDLNQLQRIYRHWTFLCLMSEQRAMSSMLSQDLLHLWNVTDLLLSSSETFFGKDDFFRYNCTAVNVICIIIKPTVLISGILRGISLPKRIFSQKDRRCNVEMFSL